MKLFFNLFGIAAAGALGYLTEPSLRFQLTGHMPSPAELAKNENVVIQMPDGAAPIEVSSLTPDQLPQRVLINTDVKVSDAASGESQVLQAGNRVKLVRIDAGNAIVSPDEGRFYGPVPITNTDLVEQVAANPPGSPPVAAPVAPPVEPAPAAVSEEPVKTPEPPPVPEPAPVAEPAPMPEAAPAPAPTGEPAAPAVAGTTDVVAAMQASIKGAQIKEFTFEQVLEWTAGTDEIVDGETYQTGLASYKAETIFGVKTIQAKALVKAGKVQRWIWPKSGMEIK